MSRAERALELINVEQIVADTCELIAGKGENPGGSEAETVRRLQTLCERVGATVELQEIAPGRPNLRASIGPETGPAILFLGHSDVVPAGEGWTTEPFTPKVRDGAIIGRGATDMKGGLAAVITAMSAVAQVAPQLRMELLCTVDEEDRARGVQAWIAANEPRDYLACVVAEPTNLEVVVGCRGAMNLRVALQGAAAHAGRPEDGASAIQAAARIIEVVRRLHRSLAQGERDSLLGVPTWNVGTISGGNGTSMVPRVAELTIDRRTMPGEDPDTVLADLLAAARKDIAESGIVNADRITMHGRVDMVMPGFRTSEDAKLTRVAAAALSKLAEKVKITGWTAACEGGFIAAHYNVPTIILGPGDINGQAHQPDERVSIQQLAIAAQAYVLIALGLVDEA